MKIRKVKKQKKYNVYNKNNKHNRFLSDHQKEQTSDYYSNENNQDIIDNLLSDDSDCLIDIVTNNSIPTNIDLPNSPSQDDAWLKLSLEIESWENTPYLKLINE